MAIRNIRFMYQILRVLYHISNLCSTSETGSVFHIQKYLDPLQCFSSGILSGFWDPQRCAAPTRTPARTTGTWTVLLRRTNQVQTHP
jgi:hypothetical protein